MSTEQVEDYTKYITFTHEIYSKSILNLDVSPEYNIGEVTLAALYRRVGWQCKEGEKYARFSEPRVIKVANVFFQRLTNIKDINKSPGDINFNDWKLALNEVLCSPKMPNQVKSKNPVLYPLVPDCTLYSSAARQKGNPWSPGKLIEKIIVTGTTPNRAQVIWREIFESFTCDPSNDKEDIWARIVALEFSKWRDPDIIWKINNLNATPPTFDEVVLTSSPAAQFISDLEKVLKLKSQLSRRQWLAVVESLLRIACASHVLWICSLNSAVWLYFKSCLLGHSIAQEEFQEMVKNNCSDFWQLEERAVPVIKNKIQSFTQSKIAINYILDQLSADNQEIVNFNSLDGIYEFGKLLHNKIKSGEFLKGNLLSSINNIYESSPKDINCKRGISANLFEFIRYSLGQKQTAEPQKRSFDQSYWLRKNGNHSAAPWVVDIGPTSILTMAYCCSYSYEQNRTIMDFLKHLNNYGFVISQRDLENSNLLDSLVTLQIIGDSPDAEGGMVILNPFGMTK